MKDLQKVSFFKEKKIETMHQKKGRTQYDTIINA